MFYEHLGHLNNSVFYKIIRPYVVIKPNFIRDEVVIQRPHLNRKSWSNMKYINFNLFNRSL